MSNVLECPKCGAPLNEAGSGRMTMQCPFCHSNILLPRELQSDSQAAIPLEPSTDLSRHAADIARMVELALSGNKLEAIKLYREVFDTSLTKSKQAVEAIASGQPVIIPEQLKPLSEVLSRTSQLEHIAELHRNGNLLEAIRLYKETFNASLKESRESVEQLAAGNLVTLPDGSTFQMNIGFASLNQEPSRVEIPRKVGLGCGTSIAIIGPAIGILIGILAVIYAFFAGKPAGEQPRWFRNLLPQPEALVAPFSTPTAIPTPTEIPYASVELAFGGEGTGAGLFQDARYVGIDREGNIYIGDIESRLIQVFDSQANFIGQWFLGQKDNGKDLYMSSMAVNLEGNVYIGSSDEIYQFSGMSGERLGKLTYPGDGHFEDLAISPDGSLVAVYFTVQENIIRFTRNGEVDLFIESPIGSVTDHSELDTTVAVDGIGNIFLLGSFNNLAFIYNREGKYQNRFGGEGEGPGTFHALADIAVDNQSRVYVGDINGVQVFDLNGRYLDHFELPMSARDMNFDLKNNLYVVDIRQIVTKYRLNK